MEDNINRPQQQPDLIAVVNYRQSNNNTNGVHAQHHNQEQSKAEYSRYINSEYQQQPWAGQPGFNNNNVQQQDQQPLVIGFSSGKQPEQRISGYNNSMQLLEQGQQQYHTTPQDRVKNQFSTIQQQDQWNQNNNNAPQRQQQQPVQLADHCHTTEQRELQQLVQNTVVEQKQQQLNLGVNQQQQQLRYSSSSMDSGKQDTGRILL